MTLKQYGPKSKNILLTKIKNIILALSLLPSSELKNREFFFSIYDSQFEHRLTFAKCLIRISDLKIMQPDLGPIDIKNSPHYLFVLGHLHGDASMMDPWKSYQMRHYPQQSIRLNELNFIKLIDEFESNSTNIVISISKKNILRKQIIVYDGAHRVAYLAAKGEEFVKCVISV